ncbi:MAG: hypothetical protein ACJ746_01450 [Bryobacteraceae bacterium]
MSVIRTALSLIGADKDLRLDVSEVIGTTPDLLRDHDQMAVCARHRQARQPDAEDQRFCPHAQESIVNDKDSR